MVASLDRKIYMWGEDNKCEEWCSYFLEYLIVNILECHIEEERNVLFEYKLAHCDCVFDSSLDLICDFEVDFFNTERAKILDNRGDILNQRVFMDRWEVPVFEVFLCDFLHESLWDQE